MCLNRYVKQQFLRFFATIYNNNYNNSYNHDNSGYFISGFGIYTGIVSLTCILLIFHLANTFT